MAWRQTTAAVVGAALALLTLAGSALAGGRHEAVAGCPALLTAEGCYWNRGRRYCSRYCYIEANGHRYCNQRESEAVPQAACEEPERPEPVYRRPRHRQYHRD
jgi:hypothetical protein